MQPSGTFVSDNIELAYFESKVNEASPSTKIPVVLVHGFASNSHMNWIDSGWFKQLNDAGYDVISFDNRGHGLSEKIYDMEQYGSHLMARDVKALMHHIGIPKAHLMGYSMGARISYFVAKDFPDILRSVTFAGMGYNMVRGIGNPEPIARALEAKSVDDVRNPAALNFRVFAEQTGSDLRALACCIRSIRVPVSKDALAEINIPALVAVGTDDVIAGSGEALAELIQGAEHLAIPGRDHMRAVGDKVYKQGVVDFLARL